MKKKILTMLCAITISTAGIQTVSAQWTCLNCATWFTQLPQYAQEIITAGASLGTQYQTTLTAIWDTIRVPMENAMITMAQQQMASNIVNWGNGGFQGNSLIVGNPEKYVQNKGLEAVKVSLGNIPSNSIYGDSIFNSIVSSYRNSDPTTQLKSLSQSSIPSIVQNNTCDDAKLSSLAYDDVKDENNDYDETAYNARKKEIYNSLCKGDPKTDPVLAKKLVAVNNQKPSLGGWDAWLATTGGDNEYTSSVRTALKAKEAEAQKKETAKAELAAGKGTVGDKKCIKWADDPDNYVDGNVPCEVYETITPSGIVGNSLEKAATAPLDRLTNLQSGGISNLLTGFLTSYLAKGINSALSGIGRNTNNSVTLNYRGPTSPTTVTGPATVTNPGPVIIPLSSNIPGAIQDLKNDPTKKAATVDPINKQLNAHLNTLNGLETIDNNYLLEIANLRAQLDGIKICNDSLISAYPETQGNPTLTSVMNYYTAKKNSTDALYNQITRELSQVSTLRTFIASTLSDIEKSNSTEEIFGKFNYYQNQVDSQGLPTITTSAGRQGELQMYKFTVQQDTGGIPGGTGNIPSFKAECTTLRAQYDEQAAQTARRNNDNGGD